MKSSLLGKAFVLCFVLLVAFSTGCKSNKEKNSANIPEYDNYDTYVFFGTDSRMGGDDWKTDDSTGTQGAPSSDVIMLLAINRENSDAEIMSIYRDTMLDVSGDSIDLQKCNSAFRIGGAYNAIDMLERNLDVYIDGYVTANFMSVAEAIDILGGVEIEIEDEKIAEAHQGNGKDTVVDIINSYIEEMNDIYDKDIALIKHPGKQVLTGLQAVAYSRVRYSAGSDMKRTERQRNVVFLMAQKLKESDEEIQRKVLKEMYTKVDTDLTETELMDVFDQIIDKELDDIGGFPFYMNNFIDKEKGDMLIPCDLISNVTELHRFLYSNDGYTPSAMVSEYDASIKKETGLYAEDAKESLSSN